MSIPVFKVLMSPNARHRAGDVLDSGYVGQGAQVAAFERAFGEAVGAPAPPLALNSCTSALDLALHLCGLGAAEHAAGWATFLRDGREWAEPTPWEVITTPITCTATNSHIWHRGARIVWADVDPLTGNLDPASVARLVTPRTKAIVAVDWAGRACDYDALRTAAPGIPIIEDAAHAFLTRRHGRSIAHSADHAFVGEVPQGGDYVCWSFQAIKALTTGDGGALLAPREHMARAKLLRWYGLDRESSADFRCAQDIAEIGYKYHMNDIAAAIGLANLEQAVRGVAACRENAAYYCRWLAGLPGVTVPAYDPDCAYWLFTILVDDRADFMAALAERGIDTTQTHARNDKHSAFKRASETRQPLPGVDAFDSQQVSIPVGWWLSEVQREYIAATVHEWAMARARGAA